MSNKNLLITICAILFVLVLVALFIKYPRSTVNNSEAPNTELKAPEASSDNTSKNSSPPPSQVERGAILDPNMEKLEKPSMTIDTSKTYTAVIKTDKGDIKIDLLAKTAPNTVNNFVYLANKQFYNNIIFHRVVKGFMIQGGDPTGTGAGGPGYSFDDEPFEGDYTRGAVAMANAGPNTNGSQFFIMQADTPLPKNYVIFGRVTEGMDVVDTIANADVQMSPSGEMSQPVNPVKMESVDVTVQ